MSDGEGASAHPVAQGETSALVAAIEALTREIAALRETVGGMQVAASSAAIARIAPAAARAAQVAKAAPLAQAPDLEVVEAERVWSDVEAVLAGLFMAALDADSDAGFEAFLELMHSDRTDAPRSIPSLREFTWKSLRRGLPSYLGDGMGPTDYTIARRVPDDLKAADRSAKLFLKAPNRSPVPIAFRRDKEQHDAWRITDSSL